MPAILKSKKARILIACAVCLIVTASLGLFVHAERLQNPDYQLSLGQKFLSELKYEEAVLAFTRVIGIDPANMEAYLGMAEAYEKLEDYEGAIRVYTQALGVEPGNETAHKRLINVCQTAADRYYEAGDYEKAILYYEKLIELDAGSNRLSAYYMNLAEIYEKQGDIEGAIAVLDRGCEAIDAEDTVNRSYEYEWLQKKRIILCRKIGIPSIPLTAEQAAYCQRLLEAVKSDSITFELLEGLYSSGLEKKVLDASSKYYGALFYGDTMNGTGMMNATLFCDWKNGIPNGPGIILGYSGLYSPNSYWITYFTLEDGNAQGAVLQRIINKNGSYAEVSGNAKDGYWDGEATTRVIGTDIFGRSYEGTEIAHFENGKCVERGEEHYWPVHLDTDTPNAFYTVYDGWSTGRHESDVLSNYFSYRYFLDTENDQ